MSDKGFEQTQPSFEMTTEEIARINEWYKEWLWADGLQVDPDELDEQIARNLGLGRD